VGLRRFPNLVTDDVDWASCPESAAAPWHRIRIGKTGVAVLFQSSTEADDRVLPATRWLSVVIVPFPLVAFVLLYIFPGDTDRLFAWTIRPDMTPLLMGAGYISGSYFFVQVFRARREQQQSN